MDTAVRLAGISDDVRITGVHVYAAKLHDVRFRKNSARSRSWSASVMSMTI